MLQNVPFEKKHTFYRHLKLFFICINVLVSQVNNRKKNQSYEGPERQHQLSLRLGDDVLRLLLTINTHTPCRLTEEGGCRLLNHNTLR